MPRWSGNILSVRGSRLSEEVNFYYFYNKAIPPMIILVENGRLRDGAADRLGDFMKQVKGDTKKFWRIAILEGESGDDARKRNVTWSGQPRFQVVKLSSEQLKDALFQEYDERNRDKVGESFRMPRLLRGDTRDFNRATASTAKSFGEEQVFQPERDRFDSWINRVLGPDLDMKYYKFKSLAPIVREPLSLTQMVTQLVKVGVLTPEEGRVIAEDIFNRDLPEIKAPWVKQPIALTLAGLTGKVQESDAAVTPPGDAMRMRKALGLGDPGDPIDIQKTVARLLEVRRALTGSTMLPDSE
jgi:capsid portal protein